MRLSGDGVLLRIFVGEQDRWDGLPLYEAIVKKAREIGLAGATAFKGFLGFGAKSHLHTTKLLRLSEDLPILIEIVDTQEHIDKFLPQLDAMVQEGLVTLEKANVVMYRKGA